MPAFMNTLVCVIKNKYKCVKLEGVLSGANAMRYIEDFRYLASCLTPQTASGTFPWIAECRSEVDCKELLRLPLEEVLIMGTEIFLKYPIFTKLPYVFFLN